jgi:hypothetical protein
MTHRLPHLLVCLLSLSAAVACGAEKRYFSEGRAEGGELRYVGDVPVLFVAGTPDEIGRQKAALTGEATKTLIQFPTRMLEMLGAKEQMPRLLARCMLLLPQFPNDHAAEMRAFSKASGMAEDLCVGGTTLMDAYRGNWGCSSLIVDANRSQTGQPLFARNLDFPTFGFLDKYNLVTVAAPKGKRKFVSVGWPGVLGVLSGMNDAGLSIAVHNAYRSGDGAPMFDPKGVPYTLCFRRILEECATVEEAEKLLRATPRTTMLSLGVCDTRRAAVFEFTPKTVEVRGAEDGVTRCTNHFLCKPLSVAQGCWRYGQLQPAAEERLLTIAMLQEKLHRANQGPLTVQSMIFEPAALKLHLSLGRPPVSDGPYQMLDVKALFEWTSPSPENGEKTQKRKAAG